MTSLFTKSLSWQFRLNSNFLSMHINSVKLWIQDYFKNQGLGFLKQTYSDERNKQAFYMLSSCLCWMPNQCDHYNCWLSFFYFQLKPYVPYNAPEINQSKFTPKDLFDSCYADEIEKQFREGKITLESVKKNRISNEDDSWW